jgi:hypothetical protein
MESVITASGLDTHWNRDTANEKFEPHPADPSKFTDRLSTLLINEQGNSRFLGDYVDSLLTMNNFLMSFLTSGASSGFSLFSPQGLQWMSERTGNDALPQFISGMTRTMRDPMPNGTAELWHKISPSKLEPLPLKEIADVYVQCRCLYLYLETSTKPSLIGFFDTFNGIFPLYDRATFDKYYDLQYSGQPPCGPAWYASLNIVFCMGTMMSQVSSSEKAKQSFGGYNTAEDQLWKYFRNACSCFVDLMFNDCSLLAVQAMCGMVRCCLHCFRARVTLLSGFRTADDLRAAAALYYSSIR